MRRRLMGALAAALMVSGLLTACGGHHSRTTAVFAQSRLQFEQAAQQVLEQGRVQGVKYPEGVQSIRLWTESVDSGATVEFLCGAGGLGTGSSYWGINYVTGDKPVGFQGFRTEYWQKEGGGTRFFEVESDNTCYVERLEKGWYYFEMEF